MKKSEVVLSLFLGACVGMLLIMLWSIHNPREAEIPQTESVFVVEEQTPSEEEQSIINLSNEYRKTQNLSELKKNDILMISSQEKVDDLCASGKWSHDGSDGRQFYAKIEDSGYKYLKAGENLAKGFQDEKSAFDGLLASPTHLENIIGDYEEIGVGFNMCGGARYIAIHYGTPQ